MLFLHLLLLFTIASCHPIVEVSAIIDSCAAFYSTNSLFYFRAPQSLNCVFLVVIMGLIDGTFNDIFYFFIYF